MKLLLSILLLGCAGVCCGQRLCVERVNGKLRTTACQEEPTIRVTKAAYKLVNSGLVEPIPCDAPAPKDSAVVCSKPAKVWVLDCPEDTVEILPRIDEPVYFDYGKAKERGQKFWCVRIIE